ncbi:MAG: hypothetical protein IJI96_02775 [Methanobrevibacter sp.]|nr:hypothetical protein [Methanobrevibacter sp.]MBQ6627431.1 hypothetical protein [Methanobrevibacter sp.]
MNLQETYSIEDCEYYITGINSNINDWVKTGNIAVTSDSNGVSITASGNTEYKAYLPVTISGDSVFEIEYVSGYKKPIGCGIYQTDNYEIGWVTVRENTTNILSHMGNSDVFPTTHKQIVVGDKFKIVYEEGYLKSYVNDELIESVSKSLTNYKYGFYSRWNYLQTIKNIKIKPL